MATHITRPPIPKNAYPVPAASQLPHLPEGVPTYWQVAIFPKASSGDGIVAWLYDKAQPAGGGGGHEAVVMPKRSPVAFWRGRQDLMTMTVPVMFDGWATYNGVVESRRRLLRMWRPDDPEDEPPVVSVVAAGDALPWQGVDWTITTVEFGDLAAGDDMTTLREQHVVTLQEYVADERLDPTSTKPGSSAKRHTSKKRREQGTKQSGKRTYRVKSGDTLSGIAASQHIKGGWRALADAQHPPISDPRSLRIGQVLTLP